MLHDLVLPEMRAMHAECRGVREVTTELQMREKSKREEIDRIRDENDMLRMATMATTKENQKLQEEKAELHEINSRVQGLVVAEDDDETAAWTEPPTWPPPKNRPKVVVIRRAQGH